MCFIHTLYPTGRSWQSWVQPLTLRFKHSLTWQFLSSDRSPQSSCWLHTLPSGTQRPFAHMKTEPLHKLSKTWSSEKKRRDRNQQTHQIRNRTRVVARVLWTDCSTFLCLTYGCNVVARVFWVLFITFAMVFLVVFTMFLLYVVGVWELFSKFAMVFLVDFNMLLLYVVAMVFCELLTRLLWCSWWFSICCYCTWLLWCSESF